MVTRASLNHNQQHHVAINAFEYFCCSLQEAHAASEAMNMQRQAAEDREACLARSEASLTAREQKLEQQKQGLEQSLQDLQVSFKGSWAL